MILEDNDKGDNKNESREYLEKRSDKTKETTGGRVHLPHKKYGNLLQKTMKRYRELNCQIVSLSLWH